MSVATYTVGLADLIKDPAVLEELQRIEAWSKALNIPATREEAEKGLDTGVTVNTLPTADDGSKEAGQRWLSGPWLFDADGANPGAAMLRPIAFGTTQNNYAPIGIDTAIGIELTPTADVTITGIKVKTIQRRVLLVINRGNYDITFVSEHPSSAENNRFEIGDPTAIGVQGDSLILPPRASMWLYYDVGRGEGKRWSLFALPAIDPANLPSSLKTAFSFPPNYQWFGSRCDGSSGTLAGMGEADTLVAGTYRNSAEGIGKDLATAAVPTAGTGVNTGGGAQVSPQHNPTWEILIRTNTDIANIRIWAALTNSVPTDADDLGGGTAYFAFRYSTVAGDAGWVGVTRDGAAQTVSAKVANIAVSTVYKLKIRVSGSTVYFSVNDGVEISQTANFPPATTQMLWAVRWFTQNATAKTITFYQHMVRFGVTF